MKGQIHAFKIFDKNLVLDVGSGSIFEVDNIAYEVLKLFEEGCNEEEITKRLAGVIDLKEIEEALEEINQLIKEGIILSETNAESILNKIKNENRVKALCLNIAHDCNLFCRYCFASKGDYNLKRNIMSKEVGEKAIDFLLKNSGDLKNLEIDFFGGEPLIAYDTVKHIIEYARFKEKNYGKKIKFTITTNALLLDDEKIKFLNENMDNIVMSLDGRKEVNDRMRVRIDGKGSYDDILPNIIKLTELRKKDNKSYYIRGTFTRYNLDFAEDVKHLSDLGFSEISIEPVLAEKEDYEIREEDLNIIYDQYEKIVEEFLNRKNSNKKFRFYHFNINLYKGPCIYKRIIACGAGREYFAVSPEGDIYPCHQFVGLEEFKMGNVSRGDLDENIRDKFKNTHIFSKEDCINCWAKFFCSGGCSAYNYKKNKDLNIPDKIFCRMQKKRIECALYLNFLNQQDA
ncbi:thioether cross-link-forming SCIFF peptide maturase [Thermovenabulum sp.]|uniref:thioether cross-link-forming SCIFF peptide maturase n=1 Tax=Thermovenabulum sp. TaxID=3100335 RepID=UPI003C7DCB63